MLVSQLPAISGPHQISRLCCRDLDASDVPWDHSNASELPLAILRYGLPYCHW
jgi:hypothetical protein